MLHCVIRNYDAEIYAFGKRLGEEFNAATLKRAFVTRFVFESRLF